MGDTADYYTDFGDYDRLWDDVKATTKSAVSAKTTTGKTAKFWILWQPESSLPPRVKFKTQKEAERVAEIMARKHRKVFYVLRAIAEFEVLPTPVSKVVL